MPRRRDFLARFDLFLAPSGLGVDAEVSGRMRGTAAGGCLERVGRERRRNASKERELVL